MKTQHPFHLFVLIILILTTSCSKDPVNSDTTPPELTLEYQDEYIYQSVNDIIAITAVVTDNSEIDRVEFYVSIDDTSQKLYTAHESPWQFNWDTREQENCTISQLYAIAWDIAGNSIQSDIHNFYIVNSIISDTAVNIWLTIGDGNVKLEEQSGFFFTESCPEQTQITIQSDLQYQEIDGFGAALTHSSALLIDNSPDRDEIIEALFDPETGIGITYIRLAIGSSDFVEGPHFSYAEVPDDTVLSEFSIDKDREHVLPVLLDILTLNPDLKIVSSPWSAPGWMKTSGNMIGGELMPFHHDTYAQYFLKYIQAYESEGIRIEAITIQNEPEYVPWNYPGMYMGAAQQADFIGNHLGPLLAENGYDTKIQVFDHNWGWDDDPVSGAQYPIEIYEDPLAYQYVDGSAWHGYGGVVDAQSIVHDAYPDKHIYFTERTNSTLWDGWDGVLGHFAKYYFVDVIRHWSRNVLLWNLTLDENNEPHSGGCDNCTGLITISADNYEFEVDYYITGHFSKFVVPGAFRIDSFSSDSSLDHVAFLNPDGSYVIIVVNTSYNTRGFDLIYDGLSLKYNLPGQAIVTFKW